MCCKYRKRNAAGRTLNSQCFHLISCVCVCVCVWTHEEASYVSLFIRVLWALLDTTWLIKIIHVTSCHSLMFMFHHLLLMISSSLVLSADFEAVSSGTEVDLVKKATCSTVEIQNNKQYLVMGASGSEVAVGRGFRSVSLCFSLSFSSISVWRDSDLLTFCPVGIVFLWTARPWWSCGPQTVVLLSVRSTSPSWRNMLWTCS